MMQAQWMAAALLCAPALALAQVVPGGPGEPGEEQKAAELQLEKPFFSGWTHTAAVGLNGSEGNTENFSFRANLKGERKTERMGTVYEMIYNRATDDSEVTANRFEARGRNDWIFADAPRWRYFLTATYEYDDFQDWQHRLSVGNGLGYAFIQNDQTLFLGRAGIGVFREFGGEDNRWHPEGILGLDLEHKFTDKQKLTATVEWLPDLLDIGPYRARAAAAYEVLLDEATNMSLKIGFEDRYDSSPGEDRKRNDLTYFAMLAWTF
jgi:putative salt-induced outer membrane protein YdiY